MELNFIIEKEIMVKDFLLSQGFSKALGRKIKLYGQVFVNEKEVKNYYLLQKDDELKIVFPPKIKENIVITEESLKILYEDDAIMIVEKPNNLAVHPSRKHHEDNLLSYVLAYFKSKNEEANCHIITRLDYPTSGIVLIAKNPYIANLLTKTKIIKKYLAKTISQMPEKEGNIHLAITREESSIIKRKVDLNGKNAHTEYKFIKEDNNLFIYELTLHTGRTHQIRVHLAYYGAFIIGDELYYEKSGNCLNLHSYYIEFKHPKTNENIIIKSYPKWF